MIINLVFDMVIVVGVGMLTFQLYLFVTMTRLKRAKKWTDKKEKRLQQMMVNLRASAAILILVTYATLAVWIIRNM